MAGRHQIVWEDGGKPIYHSEQNNLGVTDWGNLFQFAPFESGYCFLIVCGMPTLYDPNYKENDGHHNFAELQENFVRILESEFKGLSGLEDYSVETYSVGINNSQQNIISKVKGMSEANISMNFTEKQGNVLNKYVTEYLNRIRNPYSGITSYGMALQEKGPSSDMDKNESNPHHYNLSPYDIRHFRETFTFLYVVTDATCLTVEKAFLLLNAKPTKNAYSDLFNTTKGDIGVREIALDWQCSVREGASINRVASIYLANLVEHADNKHPAIKLNSYEFPYTISNGKDGNTIDKLKLFKAIGKKSVGNGNTKVIEYMQYTTSGVEDREKLIKNAQDKFPSYNFNAGNSMFYTDGVIKSSGMFAR